MVIFKIIRIVGFILVFIFLAELTAESNVYTWHDGAVSMVSNDTEEWSIYSGVPAKKLKNRKRDLLELEKDYLMSYSK